MSTVRMSTVAAPSLAGSAVLRATPWVAGAWALTFVCLSALALLDRAPHPWSPSPATALGGLTGVQVSWLIAGTAGLVLAAGIVGATARTPQSLRVSGWLLVGLGIVVTVAVSDVRALSFLGYLPMTLLALIGVGPAAGHIDVGLFTNAAAALGHAVGGLAVATSGVLVLGRAATLSGDRTNWGRWVRWGRPAVAVAAVVPLLYAVTRIAWALNVPLGVRREMLDESARRGTPDSGWPCSPSSVPGSRPAPGALGRGVPVLDPAHRRAAGTGRGRSGARADRGRRDHVGRPVLLAPGARRGAVEAPRSGGRLGSMGAGASLAGLGRGARRCLPGLPGEAVA